MSDQINYRRHGIVGASPITYAAAELDAPDAPFSVDTSSEGVMPSLDGATAWLNSPPLTTEGLRGKVVLVEFWTYTCINWLRTLPYVRGWAEKYLDQGLVVIGAHTPEFPFEHDLENVRRAAKEMRVEYPIAVDNDYGVWSAFENHYWPALYIIDAQGRIRHHSFGEGNYEEQEAIIQQLLAEAGYIGVNDGFVSGEATGAEVAADWQHQESPETYLGYERGDDFASPEDAALDASQAYTVPERLMRNRWALSGDWTIGERAAVSNAANGRIAYRFHARDLHLVMGPVAPRTSVRFRVLIDGKAPGSAHGSDVDDQGNGTLSDSRLYQLIRQPGPIADRLFEIEFLDPDAAAFAFTFG